MKKIQMLVLLALMTLLTTVVNAKPGCGEKSVQDCTTPHKNKCPLKVGMGKAQYDTFSNTVSMNECVVVDNKCQGDGKFIKCAIIPTSENDIYCLTFIEMNADPDC